VPVEERSLESFTRELTREEQEQMIDKIAAEVLKRRLETVAIMFLESIKPITYIGSQLAIVFVGPFLSVFGDFGINYIKFFENRQNVEKLLKKIEEQTEMRDEDEKKAKEDGKAISKTYNLRLTLLPGFLLRQEVTKSGESTGMIGIAGKESAGGGFIAISFEKTESSPSGLASAVSDQLRKEETQQALTLSADTVLREIEKKEDMKIRGHRTSMIAYEWLDPTGQKGRVECYGFWCNKAQRFLFLGTRTRPLKGDKTEKDHIKDLRTILGSLKCH
jgi:hypothetical protein